MFELTPNFSEEINDVLSELKSLGEFGRPIKFARGDLICRSGDHPTHMLFMRQGLVKCYQLKDGKEVILRLLSDNSAVLAYSAFITGEAAAEYIECLEACDGLWISLDEIERLRKQFPRFEIILRYMAEQHYLSMERRLLMLHHKTCEERYRYFCSTMEDKIIQETPAYVIASYLGVTPESFSRMKRQLNI